MRPPPTRAVPLRADLARFVLPLGVAALALCVACASLARAEAPDPLALGKQEFEAGQTEFNLGRYEQALAHFESSYRLTGRSALLYNIAYVETQLYARTRKPEYLKAAIERYRAYLASTPAAGADARTTAQRARAEHELAESEQKLAADEAARAKGEAALDLGEELAASGKLDEAQAQLDRYLGASGNERAGLVRADVLRATIESARGHAEAAAEAWAHALSLDRSVLPPLSAPPALRDAYAAAAAKLGSAPALAVAHAPPASIVEGAPVELVFAAASDPTSMIRGVRVHYRAGRGAYSQLPLAPLGKVALPRPFVAGLVPGTAFEYYADVEGDRGAVLSHLGSPALPFSVRVEPRTKRVATWKWLVGAGAVVVAAGAAVGVGLYLTEPPAPTMVPVPIGSALRLP